MSKIDPREISLNESVEYSGEVVREKLLKHFWGTIDYWLNADITGEEFKRSIENQGGDQRYRMIGMLFTILSTLDGCGNLPLFIIAPNPHPEDKEYHKERCEDYYPENHESNVKCDVGGSLHELFYEVGKKYNFIPGGK